MSFINVNDIRLHYEESGSHDGPVLLLLHGFPEFWFSWRNQLPALAEAGFHAIAPDLRGYNESSKPPRVRDYSIDNLVSDVVALIEKLSPGRPVALAGHDWGGIIAWFVGMRRPALIRKLIILNAPHPLAYQRELSRSPWRSSQWWRSWYVLFFQIPWLPEAILRWNDFAILRSAYAEGPARLSQDQKGDVDQYIRAVSHPGAMTAMINYYRAAVRFEFRRMKKHVNTINLPTLLLWGDRDRYLVRSLTEDLEAWVSNLRVHHFPGATHWVQHDEFPEVNKFIISFLKED